jgi:hypothetical protein
MKLKPSDLIPVEPISTVMSPAFVDYRDDSSPYGLRGGVASVPVSSYPPSELGELTRKARVMARLTLSEVAHELEIGVADMSGLERGSLTLGQHEWDHVGATIERMRCARERAVVVNPYSLGRGMTLGDKGRQGGKADG